MSQSQFHLKQKLVTLTHDSSFFTSPQPHELTLQANSTPSPISPTLPDPVCRVSEIMDDLHRRTLEELDSWLSKNPSASSTKPSSNPQLSSQTDQVLAIPEDSVSSKKWSWCAEKLTTSLHSGDAVSSPVSYVDSSYSQKTTRWKTNVLIDAAVESSQESALESSDKPSFAAFVRKCAKTPPLGLVSER